MTIWEAAMSGDAAALAAAIDANPGDLNAAGPGGWPALHLAGHFGNVECVQLLLARGADVLARSANEMSNLALHASAAGRVAELRAEVLALLLDAGTPVDATQHGGYTALHEACLNKDQASIDLLLARGADLNKAAADGRTAAAIAGA
jgi:ankyrin repeat protein